MNKEITGSGWVSEDVSWIECANKIQSSRFFFFSIIGRDSINLRSSISVVWENCDELSAPNDDQANKEVSKVRSTSTLKPKTSTITSNPASYVAPSQLRASVNVLQNKIIANVKSKSSTLASNHTKSIDGLQSTATGVVIREKKNKNVMSNFSKVASNSSKAASNSARRDDGIQLGTSSDVQGNKDINNVGSTSCTDASTPSTKVVPESLDHPDASDDTIIHTSSTTLSPMPTDSEGRELIMLKDKKLYRSEVCARIITSIFRERMDDNGHCWKTVSDEMNDFNWNEFKCSLRKKGKKPPSVTDDGWKIYESAWNTEDCIKRREQATENRLSETGGEGSGISKQLGGFISYATHLDILHAQLKREPLPHELFEKTHTKKSTTDLIDARARNTKREFDSFMDEASQQQEGSSEPHVVNMAKCFFQTNGGKITKKQKYGLGSEVFTFYPHLSESSSSRTFCAQPETSTTKIKDLRQKIVELEMKDTQRDEVLKDLLAQMNQLQEDIYDDSDIDDDEDD
ncbi:hypothetical protein ACFE04_000909 [Oxalis oulophora]